MAPNVTVGDLLTGGMIAHYQGNEKADSRLKKVIGQMKSADDKLTEMLGEALESLYDDPSPNDSKLTIDLETGETRR